MILWTLAGSVASLSTSRLVGALQVATLYPYEGSSFLSQRYQMGSHSRQVSKDKGSREKRILSAVLNRRRSSFRMGESEQKGLIDKTALSEVGTALTKVAGQAVSA